jgi:hypothetical protein
MRTQKPILLPRLLIRGSHSCSNAVDHAAGSILALH